MKILKTISVIICYKTVAYRKYLRYSQILIKTNSHQKSGTVNRGGVSQAGGFFKQGVKLIKI